MAVKLILVCLLVCVYVSLTVGEAQQSEETGGRRLADRRSNLLRRIQSRRRGDGVEKKKKFSGSEDALERRRLLFKKNPIRRRRPVNSEDNEIRDSQSRLSGRTRTSLRIRPTTRKPEPTTTTPEPTTTTPELVTAPQESELNQPKLLKGVSKFGTFSEPSGIRSRNEQIFRISFKKTTTTPTPTQPPTTTTRRTTFADITTRRSSSSFFRSKSDRQSALQALLKTANDKKEVEEDNEVQQSLPIKELPVEVKAAIQEMEDDNQQPSRSDSPRRLSTLRERRKRIRTNLGRGRTSQRRPVSKNKEEVRQKVNFSSFPQRQPNSGNGRTRLTTRPKQLATIPPRIQKEENEQQFVPLSRSQSIESSDTPVQTAPIQKTIELTEEDIFPEGREKFFADNGIFPTQEEAELEAARRNNEVLRNLQNRFVDEAPRSQSNFGAQQPPQQVVNNQFRSSVNSQPQQQPAVNNQFRSTFSNQQPQQAVNNQFRPSAGNQQFQQQQASIVSQLQAFDAQFGGSVPVSPGAAQLNSKIFSRPQSGQNQFLQQRPQFVPQQPSQPQFVPQQSQFVPQQPQQTQFVPQQPQQTQFVQQQPPVQPQQTQFQSQPSLFVPASRFSGHPADNINLNTGSFSLQTGK